MRWYFCGFQWGDIPVEIYHRTRWILIVTTAWKALPHSSFLSLFLVQIPQFIYFHNSWDLWERCENRINVLFICDKMPSDFAKKICWNKSTEPLGNGRNSEIGENLPENRQKMKRFRILLKISQLWRYYKNGIKFTEFSACDTYALALRKHRYRDASSALSHRENDGMGMRNHSYRDGISKFRFGFWADFDKRELIFFSFITIWKFIYCEITQHKSVCGTHLNCIFRDEKTFVWCEGIRPQFSLFSASFSILVLWSDEKSVFDK